MARGGDITDTLEVKLLWHSVFLCLTLTANRSVTSIAANDSALASYAQPGGIDDFDMMIHPGIF
jgi:hypothetical protein